MAGINELALVTGASCGVGFAVAKQFAKRGFDLIIADAYDEIDTAAAALSVLGTEVEAVQVDLRCADAAHVLHHHAIAAAQPIAAAALSTPADNSFLDGSLDSALAVVDQNVRGTMLLARLLAEEMVVQGDGSIVLTGSPPDPTSGLDAAVYTAGSALLRTFAETLQRELQGSGVQLAAVLLEPVNRYGGGLCDLVATLAGRAPTINSSGIARQAVQTLDRTEKHSMATRAAGAVTSLAWRVLADRVKGPVRQIISPTGEAV